MRILRTVFRIIWVSFNERVLESEGGKHENKSKGYDRRMILKMEMDHKRRMWEVSSWKKSKQNNFLL